MRVCVGGARVWRVHGCVGEPRMFACSAVRVHSVCGCIASAATALASETSSKLPSFQSPERVWNTEYLVANVVAALAMPPTC